MRLWKAREADLPSIVKMGRRFHEALTEPWPWRADDVEAFMRRAMQNGYLTVSKGGFLAGFMVPYPACEDWMVAYEVMWWAEDKSGAHHARAFRQWAKDMGANEVKWCAPVGNDRLARVYERTARADFTTYSEVL